MASTSSTKASEAANTRPKPFKRVTGTCLKRIVLEKNRHVTVSKFRGNLYVHIRDYFTPEQDSAMLQSPDGPTYIPVKGKGIALTLAQWDQLKVIAPAIDAIIHKATDPERDTQ